MTAENIRTNRTDYTCNNTNMTDGNIKYRMVHGNSKFIPIGNRSIKQTQHQVQNMADIWQMERASLQDVRCQQQNIYRKSQ
jgi:hypothetical protein